MLGPAVGVGVGVGVYRQATALFVKGHFGSLAWLLAKTGTTRSFNTKPEQGSQSIYLTTVNGNAHTSPILLGLINYLERHLPNIGFFRPVAGPAFSLNTTAAPDRHTDL